MTLAGRVALKLISTPHRVSFILLVAGSYQLAQQHSQALHPLSCDLLLSFLATIIRGCAEDINIATLIEQSLARIAGVKVVADNIDEGHLLYFHRRAMR